MRLAVAVRVLVVLSIGAFAPRAAHAQPNIECE